MRKIRDGSYTVDVECPRCHTFVGVLARLAGRLVVDAGEPGEIRLTCSSKPSPHRCAVEHMIDVPLPGLDENLDGEVVATGNADESPRTSPSTGVSTRFG